MGVLDGIIDNVTNTIGDVVDATSSEKSLTPGFDINTPDSGYFTGVEDAMTSLGGELKSPAFAKVDEMKNASTSLNVTDNLDKYTLEQAFGQSNANDMWDTLTEVQSLSDAFDECGNYAQDALSSATTDYIKNTGIQEAGRELAKKLGQGSDMVDCVSGFATLFDSAGVMDDAMGLGDLPQIQSRMQSVIRDATDPSKLSNMLINLDVVSGLLDDFNGMCTGMKDAFNKLIQSDLSAINASLNKLAQWAAFAKIANADPCALVNNNKMLSHISAPVMDDIVKLFNKATGGSAGPEAPIIPLGNILDGSALPSLPTFNQAPGLGLESFSTYFSSISAGAEDVVEGIAPMFNSAGVFLGNSLGEMGASVSSLLENKGAVEFDSILKGSNLTEVVETTLDDMAFDELNFDIEELTSSASELTDMAFDEIALDTPTIIATKSKVVSTLSPKMAAAVSTLSKPSSGSGADSATPIPAQPKPHSVSKSINRSVGKESVYEPSPFTAALEGFKQTAEDVADEWSEKFEGISDSLLDNSPWPTDMKSNFDSQNVKKEKTKTCSCVGASAAGGSGTPQQVCASRGGSWKCVSVKKDKTVSGNTYNHKKNVELSTTLPSSTPFDVSTIGV